MKKLMIAVVLVSLAVPLAAQEPAPRDRAMDRVAGFLELTEQQLSDWESLLASRDEAVAPLRQQVEDDAAALADMLAGDTPDATAVGELTIAIHDAREAIAGAHRNYVEGFEALLDTEQTARLAFIRRAERAQPLLPAFRAFGLLPRAER